MRPAHHPGGRRPGQGVVRLLRPARPPGRVRCLHHRRPRLPRPLLPGLPRGRSRTPASAGPSGTGRPDSGTGTRRRTSPSRGCARRCSGRNRRESPGHEVLFQTELESVGEVNPGLRRMAVSGRMGLTGFSTASGQRDRRRSPGRQSPQARADRPPLDCGRILAGGAQRGWPALARPRRRLAEAPLRLKAAWAGSAQVSCDRATRTPARPDRPDTRGGPWR